MTSSNVPPANVVRGEAPNAALFDRYGDGDGYGYGYGDGYGYGYGDGYGYGYGYGDKAYWLSVVPGFAAKWPPAQRDRLAELQAAGATIAYWRSSDDGKACNGGRSTAAVKPGTVETVAGPLKICTERALHATFIPPKWKGERWWIVALIGATQEQDDKVGALTREIVGECL